jgi:hypothetical protein
VKRIVLIVSAFIWITPATLRAGQATLGWPEVIALLTKARTQATTCVEVLKSSGDKAALASARLTYGMAEGDMDGVIRGLTTALIEGGDPDRLPTVRTSLEALGKSLKEICDAAVKTITPNTKGVREEVAKGAVEPLFGAISDGAGELWTRPVEKDKLAGRPTSRPCDWSVNSLARCRTKASPRFSTGSVYARPKDRAGPSCASATSAPCIRLQSIVRANARSGMS